MQEPQPDPVAIRSTFRWLAHGEHGVSEVRVIRPGGGVAGIGFFDDEDAFVRECVRGNAAGNVYVGIQPRPPRLLSLAPNAIRPLRAGAGAKDVEVATATVIDVDAVRPKDTAATEQELAQALAAAGRAAEWCRGTGLTPPVRVMSGNGAQLWFALPAVALQNGTREAVQAGLKAFEAEVRARAEGAGVRVDSIHDLARIIKVVGTVSRKGAPSPERPHRTSAALDPMERREDAALAARLRGHVAPPDVPAAPVVALPSTPTQSPTLAVTARARRTPEGAYVWVSPVDMCGPVRRLWEQGHEDRSVAIFDMVRFFAHKGLPLDEITDLVLEYDRRGLGKLQGRDAAGYVRRCHEKIAASARGGSIPPPCHSLQKIGYCGVNQQPSARCDVYEQVVAELRREQQASQPPGAAAAGDSSIDGEIFEDAACYFTVGARGDTKVISSFTLTPLLRVASDDGEVIVCDAVTDTGGTIRGLRLPLRAFHSKRDLVRHLPSADLQWTGSDNNAQGLLRLLSRRPVPRRLGTAMLGDCRRGGHHLWVTPRGAIGAEGLVEDAPVAFVPNGASLEGRLRYTWTDDTSFRDLAHQVFRLLPRLNTPEVMVPVLGWFFATPMKPRLMERTGSFPTLFIWGSQGSGKSSLVIDVLWPLFGVADAEPYSATETEFALIRTLSATTSIPIFIDEYKPYDMPRHRLASLHRFLRRLYRGETEERGRPDQTVSTYRLQAPVCVAGETRPSEAALLERIITANPDKVLLVQQEEYRSAFRELRSLDLAGFAARYIAFCLGRDLDADHEVAGQVVERLLAGRRVPPRVATNLTAMVLGVHLFEQFALHCGYHELPADLGVGEAVGAVLDDLLETAEGVKTPLEHFVEMLGVMATQGEIEDEVHFVVRDGVLYVHLETAYDSFRQHCRRIDYEGELVDLKALRRLIQENRRQGGYVTSEGERVYFKRNADRRRAFSIDFSRTDLVSAADFPHEDAVLPWGGGE